MAQHEGDVVLGAQVGDPVPGEHALGADDEPVAEGGNGAEEGVGAAGQVAIEDRVAGLVEDADVHRPRMQVDAASEGVLLVVESHHSLPVRGTMRWVCRNFQHTR